MAKQTVAARGNILGPIIPARFILAILGSIGMAIVYGLKVNLSVAMVAMLNHTAIQQMSSESSPVPLNFTAHQSTVVEAEAECLATATASGHVEQPEDGPFDWSEPLQGTILSCYFWGYFVSQIPGARVAEQFSAKYVMLFSVALNVVCTLLTPFAASYNYAAMIAMRIGQGIGGGVTFPAMHVMLAAWAPPAERSVLASIVYAGTSLGTVASMLMAGMLAAAFGWQSVFYAMGGLSVLWLVLWSLLVQDSPERQPWISEQERQFIVQSLSESGGGQPPTAEEPARKRTPWRAIGLSGPFWAILIAHCCSNWGWYMLLIELPFYMKQVLKFNIKENALATALPFLTMWFFSMLLSRGLDVMRKRGLLTTTTARKVSTICASAVPAVCMLALCYIGCMRGLAVLLMGIGITSIGGMFSGFLANHIDIAPRFAGTLMAITNTAATVPGIVVPIFVGSITHGNQTIEAWRVIFFVTIALYVVEIFAYGLLGSGDEQPWNRGQTSTNAALDNEDANTASTAEVTPLNTDDVAMKKMYTDEAKI